MHGFPQFLTSFVAEVRFAEVREVAFALTFRSLFVNTVCMLYCHFLVCGLVCGGFLLYRKKKKKIFYTGFEGKLWLGVANS